jgi:hypothetical protein
MTVIVGILCSDGVLATYQLRAADRIQIAQGMTDPKSRVSLLAMAQSWLKLGRAGCEEQRNDVGLRDAPTERDALARLSLL